MSKGTRSSMTFTGAGGLVCEMVFYALLVVLHITHLSLARFTSAITLFGHVYISDPACYLCEIRAHGMVGDDAGARITIHYEVGRIGAGGLLISTVLRSCCIHRVRPVRLRRAFPGITRLLLPLFLLNVKRETESATFATAAGEKH
ncbi:hypothetical protein DFS34DRAFT_607816 [Phlyctochytrium arcticum]|nr:hypothetical protein DFS34DRAFT_607816 [Phlyctochytrium arcticum]